MGFKGWLAVLIGFVGVLLIVKPNTDDFNGFVLLPLVSSILYSLSMILTRTKCRDESATVLALLLNAVFGVFGILLWVLVEGMNAYPAGQTTNPFLLGQWHPLDTTGWLTILLLSIIILISSIGVALAYQLGKSSTVSTFDFTYVAFATGWGFLLFREIPDLVTVAAILLVIGGGLIAIRS